MADQSLTRETRDSAIQRLMESVQPGRELDVLVIGGGITGAGIALDAATRGLDTVVVESQDWAAGSSSRASKLIHGGLRYLQMLDFKLVHEALTERDLLLNNVAPHLVRPLPFLYPLRHHVWERAFVGAGIALYDFLASVTVKSTSGKRSVPWHRHLSRKQLAVRFPGLAHDAAVGAIEYWDANVDDARYVVSVIRTASAHGAGAATRMQVVEITKNDEGVVNGAVMVDLETGKSFPVRAKAVINSTGVWTGETQALANESGGLKVLASKGIHIVVPRERIKGEAGLILQTSKSVLFVIPWSRYWVIGTTDTPWKENLLNPAATADDIDYVIAEANAVLANPIDRTDVIGTWAGLRPLLQPGTMEGTNSAKVSREHTVASPIPGLTVIAGGKFTTYRVMAKDAVDFAIGKEAAKANPSTTATVALLGAEGLEQATAGAAALGAKFGWSAQMVDHLLHRYGAKISEIAAIAEEEPAMGKPLAQASAYLRAEIAYAITHEGALHLEDLMVRRTRMNYEYLNEAMAAVPEVAEIAATLLGWDEQTTAHEVATYSQMAEAVAAAALTRDDESASDVREAAPQIVPLVTPAAPEAK
ncbi:glycerol-3-phosphate dehydrogenase/oxidase [Salinibacterium sp. SWN1162]|uniref:glycerol-3-phosphate dehydrogenase/oxidase n=1 Tax=Salinibacterium sp. SWN1162 TaxID=2792053 RepID=UPI0018CD1FE9|nr:glycerol-3-phosphate dehydrogenase/oxidase [Salinibacterium sp. SWN1162]MBH0009889.1 glycerol-3-phosphate dehydrogenase/oxidase [Salinibacterium sp. SWN1162]